MSPLLLLASLACGQSAPKTQPSDAVVSAADKLTVLNKACGPISAYYCAKRLGRDMSFEDFTKGMTLGEAGIDLDEVQRLLGNSGIRSEAIRVSAEHMESLPVPSILVIRPAHAVVLDGWEPGLTKVRVFEPATGRLFLVNTDAIRNAWTGEAVVFGRPMLPPWEFGLTAFVVAAGVCFCGTRLLRRKSRPRPTSPSPEPAHS